RPAPWREEPSGRVAADLLLQLGVEAAYFGVDARIPRLRTTGSERHHADQRGTDHQRSAGVTLAGILPALGITRAHHAVGHEELAVGSPAVLVGVHRDVHLHQLVGLLATLGGGTPAQRRCDGARLVRSVIG